MDLDNVYIAHIAALKGTTIYRRRHKRSLGMRMKTAHLEVILKERERKSKKEKNKESVNNKSEKTQN